MRATVQRGPIRHASGGRRVRGERAREQERGGDEERGEAHTRSRAGTVIDGLQSAPMRSAAVLAALTCGLCLGLAACGNSTHPPAAPTEPAAAPGHRCPPPTSHSRRTSSRCGRSSRRIGRPSRSCCTTGSGRRATSRTPSDASYGIGTEDFAKQMTMIQHAGYETIDLQTFIDFVQKSGSISRRDRCC